MRERCSLIAYLRMYHGCGSGALSDMSGTRAEGQCERETAPERSLLPSFLLPYLSQNVVMVAQGRGMTNQAHFSRSSSSFLACLAFPAHQLSHVKDEQQARVLPLGAQRLRRAVRKGMMGMEGHGSQAERKVCQGGWRGRPRRSKFPPPKGAGRSALGRRGRLGNTGERAAGDR